jgi:acyl dehydratase
MQVTLDSLPLGQPFSCGSFTLTEAEIIAFASQFDPQPWHLDDAVARQTYFNGLCASGLHSQAASIGLMVRAIADVAIIAGGALNEARFFVPVRPNRPYLVTATWISARRSASNPSRGVAAIVIVTHDGEGAKVMQCGVTYIVAT